MSTVFKFKKHVSVVCDLSVGDKVTVSDWGYKLDGKECIIEDIKESFVGCSSGVLVRLTSTSTILTATGLIRHKYSIHLCNGRGSIHLLRY